MADTSPFSQLTGQSWSRCHSFLPVWNAVTGAISATGATHFWGAEANAWKNLFYNGPCTTYGLSLIAGARFLEADLEFDIQRGWHTVGLR